MEKIELITRLHDKTLELQEKATRMGYTLVVTCRLGNSNSFSYLVYHYGVDHHIVTDMSESIIDLSEKRINETVTDICNFLDNELGMAKLALAKLDKEREIHMKKIKMIEGNENI